MNTKTFMITTYMVFGTTLYTEHNNIGLPDNI